MSEQNSNELSAPLVLSPQQMGELADYILQRLMPAKELAFPVSTNNDAGMGSSVHLSSAGESGVSDPDSPVSDFGLASRMERFQAYEIRKARARIGALGPANLVARLTPLAPDGRLNPKYDEGMLTRLRLALSPLPGGDPVWHAYWGDAVKASPTSRE